MTVVTNVHLSTAEVHKKRHTIGIKKEPGGSLCRIFRYLLFSAFFGLPYLPFRAGCGICGRNILMRAAVPPTANTANAAVPAGVSPSSLRKFDASLKYPYKASDIASMIPRPSMPLLKSIFSILRSRNTHMMSKENSIRG